MMHPEYLICLECESPVYVFTWQDGHLVDVTCPVCGNDEVASFATEEEIEEMELSEASEDEGFEA